MKYNYKSVILLLFIIITGCEKKVLDLQPFNSFSDETAFSSAARVELTMNGVYDAAQSGFYAGGAVRGYPFGAANIQQADMRGEDMLNQALFYQITYEATYSPTSPNNAFMFQTLYNLVNKANLVIEGVAGAVGKGLITQAQADQYTAESRFLRAMAHHELLIHHARPYADGNGNKLGIIYRETGINSEQEAEEARKISRQTIAENYTKILADLDYAETNLPATTPVKTYRASRAAAIALKMRVKLHMRDWDGVITEGNKIVSAAAPYTSTIGGWKLTALPDGPFTNNQSDESIFSIKNDATDNAGVNGSLASMAGNPANGGRGLVRISPVIWSDTDWKCNDLRRSLLAVQATTSSVYTTKYKDIANGSDAAPQIRYAEVLLMLAEAEARKNTDVSARAFQLLNAVRNRSVTTLADQYTIASFPTKTTLIAAILKERRIEFLAEGKRWADIHRLAVDPDFAPIPGGGIPSKVGSGAATAAMFNCAGVAAYSRPVPAIPYADFRFIWPIPIEEIQQNPNFPQNPGY